MVWDSYDVYDNRMILLGSFYTAIGQGIWVVGVQVSYSLVIGVIIWMLDVRIYLIPISRFVGEIQVVYYPPYKGHGLCLTSGFCKM